MILLRGAGSSPSVGHEHAIAAHLYCGLDAPMSASLCMIKAYVLLLAASIPLTCILLHLQVCV